MISSQRRSIAKTPKRQNAKSSGNEQTSLSIWIFIFASLFYVPISSVRFGDLIRTFFSWKNPSRAQRFPNAISTSSERWATRGWSHLIRFWATSFRTVIKTKSSIDSVWPDVGIKFTQFLQNVAKNVTTTVFTLKIPKNSQVLGFVCNKNCCPII